MKGAGSVRGHITGCILCVLSCLAPVPRALTPPRVLYGGWTPIVPGHPFYFGPAKNLERFPHQNHRHVHYAELSLSHFPAHGVEHEAERHVEFVSPKQHPGEQRDTEPAGKAISYGRTPQKDIFSFYPQQSTYGVPKQPGFNDKPVYFEAPGKPPDVFENSHLFHLTKNVPAKSLHLHDLKSIHEEAVLGHVEALELIHADRIRHLVAQFPVLKESAGGTPKRHPVALSYMQHDAPVEHPSYEIRSPKQTSTAHVPYDLTRAPKGSVNTYEGNEFKLDNYPSLDRPLNPIETKHFRNPRLLHVSEFRELAHTQLPKQNSNGYGNLHWPVLSPGPLLHPTLHPGPHSSIRYPPSIRSAPIMGLGGNIAHPMKSNVALLTKPRYPAVRYPHHTSNNFSPSYLRGGVKLRALYRNPPSVTTSVRGSPVVVEREVAILHVPVTSQQRGYPDDYLYHTPGSTQVLSDMNGSIPYALGGRHIPAISNNSESYTRIMLDFGKGQDSGPMTFADPSVDSQIAVPPVMNSADDVQDQHRYIFVSSNGIRGGSNLQNDVENSRDGGEQTEAKKQFFHAYYSSPHHTPPPGYVKMTLPEFNNLFKNAEIRYVDQDPERISRKQQSTPLKSISF